jgi:hypothetical protein
MTHFIARALGALVVVLLAHAVANAQPAPVDWTCTQWRTVNQTALNPFGRECTQWARSTQAGEAKAKKPNSERKGKRKKTSKPRR